MNQQEKKVLDTVAAEIKEREGGRYKIDLLFGSGFSVQKPSAGILSFWESGRALHGDGDTKLYLCPTRDLQLGTCEAFIPGHGLDHNFAVCPNCGHTWKSGSLIGEVAYRLMPVRWAEVLTRWFHRLNNEADIRIIYPPDDIRSLSAREQERQRGGELLERGRERRATRTYPLRNIIKDTAAGAALESKILGFVRS